MAKADLQEQLQLGQMTVKPKILPALFSCVCFIWCGVFCEKKNTNKKLCFFYHLCVMYCKYTLLSLIHFLLLLQKTKPGYLCFYFQANLRVCLILYETSYFP